MMYGWVFAIFLVLLIFIHEMGHVIALRQKGYPLKAPLFIPLLGAVIFAPSGMNRSTEAYVGIGGPVLGTIGALVLYLIWYIYPTHPSILLSMSFVGIAMNLFNMIPIRPLDGGRITQAASSWFMWIGIVLLMSLTIALKDPGLLIIWILALDDMDNLSAKVRLWIGGGIFIAMITLFAMSAGKENSGWWYGFDIIIGILFLLLLVTKYKKEKNKVPIKNEDAIRPSLSKSSRILWLSAYVVLISIMIITLFFQKQELLHIKEIQDKEQKHLQPQIGKTAPAQKAGVFI